MARARTHFPVHLPEVANGSSSRRGLWLPHAFMHKLMHMLSAPSDQFLPTSVFFFLLLLTFLTHLCFHTLPKSAQTSGFGKRMTVRQLGCVSSSSFTLYLFGEPLEQTAFSSSENKLIKKKKRKRGIGDCAEGDGPPPPPLFKQASSVAAAFLRAFSGDRRDTAIPMPC